MAWKRTTSLREMSRAMTTMARPPMRKMPRVTSSVRVMAEKASEDFC